MSKRQVQKMFRLMASGEAVELTSAMASVKKLARLAFIAEQFGYQYADVRQSGGQNNALKMLILPDPGPQAQTRAAQNWAQYPQAAGGGPLPPFVPDALELLKARINFDLTGKNAEKRMLYAGLGVTVGCVVLALRTGGDGIAFAVSGIFWVLLVGILGIGVAVTRKRNAKFAARLQGAGFTAVTDETGRVRYLPPGWQMPGGQLPGAQPLGAQPSGAQHPGQGNPFAGQHGGQPAQQYGQPGQQYGSGPYGSGPYGSGPYGGPQGGAPVPGPYAPQQPQPQQQAPGPYAPPQAPSAGPYGGQPGPGPYAQPQPQPPSQPQPNSPYGRPQPPQH
ncbi:hypothetical protein FE633_28375 [Streptomyces montanus]|uniref:Integral membrane protein n=1 Tax=Streptomyces montanus TaxID=2580423 RepID=A0A5R9FTP4_9ACTN|nr:hypothetical protein [Streptomyces montanus]TLS42915.1 hypothetical protein FE633_28375 [Streptomyces montanus]